MKKIIIYQCDYCGDDFGTEPINIEPPNKFKIEEEYIYVMGICNNCEEDNEVDEVEEDEDSNEFDK